MTQYEKKQSEKNQKFRNRTDMVRTLLSNKTFNANIRVEWSDTSVDFNLDEIFTFNNDLSTVKVVVLKVNDKDPKEWCKTEHYNDKSVINKLKKEMVDSFNKIVYNSITIKSALPTNNVHVSSIKV